ncbi:MAG TPA: hypothetical protein VK738_11605 [Terriglobales bacterium]|nr:hypothetical protein [Terriglobales bacterium]
MKKLIFTIALTLALTTGIASPISAAALTTKTPITNIDKGCGSCGPTCDPQGNNCII